MSARSKARKRAIDMLYGADLRGSSINEAVSEAATRALTDTGRDASWTYAREIVLGIADHGDEIDELIETYSQGWTLARMPVVDRAIIRIGIWELLFNDAVPDTVAIAEAVAMASQLSTEDSGKFVNGLLARIAQTRV